MGYSELDDLQKMFIQNVSHELRTPLSIIQGYTELLHNEELGPLTVEQRAAIHNLLSSTRDLQQIVERVNTLLAIETQPGVRFPFSLASLVLDVLQSQKAIAQKSNIALELFVEPHLPLVLGDGEQIRQAVECVIENAIKFTPAGGHVTVRIYTEPNLPIEESGTNGRGSHSNSWVCISVSDTGIGIPEHILKAILSHNFRQGDGSSTRRYGGIGLGLTLVKKVIAAHNGHLEIESVPDKGSRFVIHLPQIDS